MSIPSAVPPWDARLAGALRTALEAVPGSTPKSLLFSGGVDSGLLAWELRADPALSLATVGLHRSPDLDAADRAAEQLSLPWVPHTLSEAEVFEMDRRLETETRGLGPTARSVEVAFALAVATSPPGTVLCGQGVDELFFGYAHFRGLRPEAAARRGDDDLRNLLGEAWPRTVRIANLLGREVVAPYLDPEFLRVAQEIPVLERLAGPEPKHTFRAFARRRGLPEVLASRPKKALQYGSGVDRVLRRQIGRGGTRPPGTVPPTIPGGFTR